MTGGGRQTGEAHVASLAAYLASLRDNRQGLPVRSGKVNSSAVAHACGFNREVLYQNPRCKEMLTQATTELGIVGIETRPEAVADPERKALENRVATLERRNAALQAEVYELRRQLKNYDTVEAILVQSGRRVIP
ncbi:DUF6262 family protein [Acidiphilium sp.]|uniref:DUF6262 family protein n=1 Tax=Acidiphilium sp. TaxID=527 RepID=UPI00258F26A7|nr:DUF6262 family protein [Acidiphilium sp.]